MKAVFYWLFEELAYNTGGKVAAKFIQHFLVKDLFAVKEKRRKDRNFTFFMLRLSAIMTVFSTLVSFRFLFDNLTQHCTSNRNLELLQSFKLISL